VIKKITNIPRDYAWGSHSLIPDYFGVEPTGKPMAEIWLGTHEGSPAFLQEDSSVTLLELREGRQLSFLLKILAAETPLSIQAHPNPQQAIEGFAREEAAHIPLGASHRNYKDARAKPEMIVALSRTFDALCGFAPVETTRPVLVRLRAASEPLLADEIDGWLAALDSAAPMRQIFGLIMQLPEAKAALLGEQAARAAQKLDPDQHEVTDSLTLLGKLQRLYPGDRGVLLSLFLNFVSLKPGEAIALPAGNIHAYIYGLGVEIMASSDNVLRGGLTPKHIDVAELESILDFRATPPPVVAPKIIANGLVQYPSPTDDFLLYRADLSGSTVLADLNLPNASILLCTSGEVAVSNSIEQREVIKRGEAVYVAKDARAFSLAGSGTVFIATSPEAS
jgi:mannose-6-phosphate isomerase